MLLSACGSGGDGGAASPAPIAPAPPAPPPIAPPPPVAPPPVAPPPPTSAQLLISIGGIDAWDKLANDQRARLNASQRSFFLHQSVGGDLEDGAQAVGYRFNYIDSNANAIPLGLNGGLFTASNGDYAGKITEFRRLAIANRSSLNVAIMK
ncbi:MAG: hypothetical protein ACRDAM_14555, partial [Casimicrobium sp.]